MLALSSLSALTIDIYVENINFANDGYNFYTDSSKTTELNFSRAQTHSTRATAIAFSDWHRYVASILC